jgi:uncharacterized protein YcbK (DUF882 family)
MNAGWHVAGTVALSGALARRSIRAGLRCGVAALLLVAGVSGLQTAAADGETRTISFHHIHTKEDLTVTYKVNGRYDEEALAKINNVLRDWRDAQPIKMDPHLIDVLWEVHRETGSKEPISVVCGYRSPGTNAMLRRRSSGVAENSQHMLGKAVDFFIKGVPIDQIRAAGLRAQRGGVGYYPSSNFVHLDTGSVRHWPRMPEAQLAAVLAKGQLASANASDDGTVKPTAVASAERGGLQSFLSNLFGGGKTEEPAPAAAPAPEKPAQVARASTTTARAPDKPVNLAAAPAPQPKQPAKSATAGYQVASATAKPVTLDSAVDKPQGVSPAAKTQTYQVASASAVPVRPAQASSLFARAGNSTGTNAANNDAVSANDVISQRGFWQGAPQADEPATSTVARTTPAKRPQTETTASVAPWPMPERDGKPAPSTLAYAQTDLAARPAAKATGAVRNAPASPDVLAAAKNGGSDAAANARQQGPNLVRVGDRFNDPWMRALMITPSTQSHMRTTLYGAPDFTAVGPLMLKPATTVAMTFADDPNPGLATDRFTGNPVTFTPTVAFAPKTTAVR